MVMHRYPIAPIIQDYRETIAEAIEAHFFGLNHVAIGGLVLREPDGNSPPSAASLAFGTFSTRSLLTASKRSPVAGWVVTTSRCKRLAAARVR